jgi:hypothetical protein
MERAGESTDFKNVLKQISSLAHKLYMYCNCIIVVSETNDVFQFDSDERQKFIFVEEMTKEESEAYLKLKGLTFEDAKQMDELYEKIGGNATVLDAFRLLRNEHPFHECLKLIVSSVTDDLEAFQIQPILQALKQHPEGARAKDFKKQEYKGIDLCEPKNVGDAIKKRNAVIYRMDLSPKVYQPLSTRHKTALKSYEPRNDKPWYWPW